MRLIQKNNLSENARAIEKLQNIWEDFCENNQIIFTLEKLKDNAWVREILDKYILPFDIYSLFKDGNDPKPDIQFLNIVQNK
ncbi:hypothetical protein [Lysinibacillus irui]|uniref:hypothetical protein n=1 Tax=Lysinibacillus irui TaxID=2998077 RepID=UPI002AD2373A|nr:hypothetical protein [Lysinibacillus irui]MEA0566027.1 hypothetical protein [Lysinibacillus irui]